MKNIGTVWVLLFFCVPGALLLCPTARAGQVMYKNLYLGADLIQGEGPTLELATLDAYSAMPSGYSQDLNNASSIDCTASSFKLMTEGAECDETITGNQFRVTLPIVLTETQSL